jgi:branched-chain amino acid transport system permease protein
VIGGIGSIRGAFVAALLVGFIDTLGRAFFPDLLVGLLGRQAASTAAPALSSMLIYILMAGILVVRPQGLFSAGTR